MELTFFTLICCKNCFVCLKRPKINEKVAQVGPLKKLLYAEIKLSDWLNEVTRYCHSIRVFFGIVKLHYSIICLWNRLLTRRWSQYLFSLSIYLLYWPQRTRFMPNFQILLNTNCKEENTKIGRQKEAGKCQVIKPLFWKNVFLWNHTLTHQLKDECFFDASPLSSSNWSIFCCYLPSTLCCF